MSTLGRRVLAISSTVDVISGECDASEELARWCLVVVDVVMAGFAIGRLPVGSFIDVAFLLLFLTFSFQAADEIVFNLFLDLRDTRFLVLLLEVRFDVIGNLELFGRSYDGKLLTRLETVGRFARENV